MDHARAWDQFKIMATINLHSAEIGAVSSPVAYQPAIKLWHQVIDTIDSMETANGDLIASLPSVSETEKMAMTSDRGEMVDALS